jgi:hypothetical protein
MEKLLQRRMSKERRTRARKLHLLKVSYIDNKGGKPLEIAPALAASSSDLSKRKNKLRDKNGVKEKPTAIG